jgi:uncharacterized protein YegJ (DUF2314 family)
MLFSFPKLLDLIEGRARFMFFRSVVALLALFPFGVAFALDPNPVPSVPKADPAMSAAFARAAAGLDGFFAKLSDPPRGAERFSVKIGLMDAPGRLGYTIVRPDSAPDMDDGVIEWFWVNALRTEGTGFSGKIANDPEYLHNVSAGQMIHFARQDIGDWMYFQNGKIIGNATACPALAHASAAEQRLMAEKYGFDCK